MLLSLIACPLALAQSPSYPKVIRGYKVERAAIEIKKSNARNIKPASNTASSDDRVDNPQTSDSDVDELIQFGKPQLARLTPLGVTFEVPIVVAPVTQKGRVDFLVFEDMVVNGNSVQIGEYHRSFDLPRKKSLTLHEPLRFYVYLPRAVLAGIDEWINSKETWPVTGHVYVFGKFKKGLLSFRRCVPVELNLTMRNPLK